MKIPRVCIVTCLLILLSSHKVFAQVYGARTKQERDKAIVLAFEEARKGNAEIESPASKNISSQEEAIIPPTQKGAWTLRQGKTYAEIHTKYYWHNHRFDDNAHKKLWNYSGKYNELRSELKLEHGYTNRTTLMLYTVAKEAHWKDNFASYTKKGFVEIWPGIRRLLFQTPFICSLQIRAKFPLNYSEEATPALGTHQIDEEIKILTAQPWPKLPGYTKFETGFRGRHEEPANEIPYFFEAGYSLNSNLILKVTLDGQEGLASTGGIDEDWIKGTVGPIFKINDLFNVELGYGNTFYGKNTSAAKEVYVSLSTQW